MQTDGLCPQLAAPAGQRAWGRCALLLWINGRKDSSALAFLLTRNALKRAKPEPRLGSLRLGGLLGGLPSTAACQAPGVWVLKRWAVMSKLTQTY